MAKEKAHQVIVHRIEFQQKEREVLEQLAAGITLNNVASPAVALLSDASGLAALAGILELAGITDIIPDDFDISAYFGVDAALAGLNDALDRAEDIAGDLADIPGELGEAVREANPITKAKRKAAQAWVLLKFLAATAASQVPDIHGPNIVR